MRPRSRKPMLHRLVAAAALFSCVLTPVTGGADAYVTSAVDPASATVTLGDPVRYNLTISHSADLRPDRVSLSEFDVDVDVTQLAAAPPLAGGDGLAQTVLSWELRFFELGDHTIPEMEIALVSAAGERETLRSNPVAVSVGSVREEVTDSDELFDIKPPVVIPGGVPLWLAVVVLTLAVAIAVALLHWLLQKRKRAGGETAIDPPVPVDYIVEFKKIARMGLVERQAFLVYYTMLSETLRRFLEDRVGVDAMERTTEEVAQVLRQSPVDSVQADRVQEFLSQADLVKFACAEPVAEQALRAPEIGQQIVRDVEARLAAERERAAARERAMAEEAVKSGAPAGVAE